MLSRCLGSPELCLGSDFSRSLGVCGGLAAGPTRSVWGKTGEGGGRGVLPPALGLGCWVVVRTVRAGG